MTELPAMVTLPTGLIVERRGGALYESCPDHETKHYRNDHGGHVPEDMDGNGHSRKLRQTKCPTCGLWALWVPRLHDQTREMA